MDVGEDFNVAEIGSQSGEQWELGGSRIDGGSDNDDSTLHGSGAVWHGTAIGDVSGEGYSEQAFACAMIAVEQGDGTRRETLLPEPADGSGSGRGELAFVGEEGDGEWVCLLVHHMVVGQARRIALSRL